MQSMSSARRSSTVTSYRRSAAGVTMTRANERALAFGGLAVTGCAAGEGFLPPLPAAWSVVEENAAPVSLVTLWMSA